MALSNPIICIVICLSLVGIGILITVKLARLTTRDHHEHDPEHSFYHDDDGHHSYYERSLIEKTEFSRRNPSIPPHLLRTFRRLLTLE